MNLLFPVLLLGSLGFVFGVILAYAGLTFAVEENPQRDLAASLLPGVNCGGCGFPGCSGFAEALVEKGARLDACKVLSPSARSRLAQALGKPDPGSVPPMVAVVMCGGDSTAASRKFVYRGLPDCEAALLLAKGPWLCGFRCLGQGSCVRVCPFQAIRMGPAELPIIDPGRCTGCGACAGVCPKRIIRLVDQRRQTHVLCSSTDPGREVRKFCEKGCIGCRLCEKICTYRAIAFENNLARIDYSLCVECGACVSKCPTRAIVVQRASGPLVQEEPDR